MAKWMPWKEYFHDPIVIIVSVETDQGMNFFHSKQYLRVLQYADPTLTTIQNQLLCTEISLLLVMFHRKLHPTEASSLETSQPFCPLKPLNTQLNALPFISKPCHKSTILTKLLLLLEGSIKILGMG